MRREGGREGGRDTYVDTTEGEGDSLEADHGGTGASGRRSALARDLGRKGGREGGKEGVKTRRYSKEGREGGMEGGREGSRHSYPLPKGLSACWDVLHLQGPHVVVYVALRFVALVRAALGRHGRLDLEGGR